MSKLTDYNDTVNKEDQASSEHNINDTRNPGGGVAATEVAADAQPQTDPRDRYFAPEQNNVTTLFRGMDDKDEMELRRAENKKKSDSLRPLA